MKTLTSGWTVRASAWGSTTSRMMSPKGIPRARAASICPLATELMPERTASHTYPEPAKRIAPTAAENREIGTPARGATKASRSMRHRVGILQAIVTHTAPSARSGGTGLTRHTAMSVPTTSAPT